MLKQEARPATRFRSPEKCGHLGTPARPRSGRSGPEKEGVRGRPELSGVHPPQSQWPPASPLRLHWFKQPDKHSNTLPTSPEVKRATILRVLAGTAARGPVETSQLGAGTCRHTLGRSCGETGWPCSVACRLCVHLPTLNVKPQGRSCMMANEHTEETSPRTVGTRMHVCAGTGACESVCRNTHVLGTDSFPLT